MGRRMISHGHDGMGEHALYHEINETTIKNNDEEAYTATDSIISRICIIQFREFSVKFQNVFACQN